MPRVPKALVTPPPDPGNPLVGPEKARERWMLMVREAQRVIRQAEKAGVIEKDQRIIDATKVVIAEREAHEATKRAYDRLEREVFSLTTAIVLRAPDIYQHRQYLMLKYRLGEANFNAAVFRLCDKLIAQHERAAKRVADGRTKKDGPGRPSKEGAPTRPYTLKLTQERRDRLDRLAEKMGMDASDVLRSAMDELFARHEVA